MAKPMLHANNSVKRFGGKAEDYLAIHDKIDLSKSSHASMRHRVIFHSALGIYLIEDIFGHEITNSDGRKVSVRDIAERHIIEDLGWIPSLDDWLKHMTEEPWMAGAKRLNLMVVD